MSYIEITLLAILYILSAGYLSSIYIVAGDNMQPKVAKVLLMLIFVPGINTMASVGMTVLIWYDSMIRKGEADG